MKSFVTETSKERLRNLVLHMKILRDEKKVKKLKKVYKVSKAKKFAVMLKKKTKRF